MCEHIRQPATLQFLRHLGVREDDRVAVLHVRHERDMAIDMRLELIFVRVVDDDRDLRIAGDRFSHPSASLNHAVP